MDLEEGNAGGWWVKSRDSFGELSFIGTGELCFKGCVLCCWKMLKPVVKTGRQIKQVVFRLGGRMKP